MRYTITNNSKAPRGVHNAAGRLVFIQPGESRTMEVAKIEGIKRIPSLTVVADPEDLPPPPADLRATLAQLDHDRDGKAGGSIAAKNTPDRPALIAAYKAKTGKNIFPGWSDDEIKRRMDAA
jgi:hypothetical protein